MPAKGVDTKSPTARASADAINDLLPQSAGQPAAAPTMPPVMVPASPEFSLPPLPDTAATQAIGAPNATIPPIGSTPSALPALAPLPSSTDRAMPEPKQPMTLEEEAAAAGVAPPQQSLPPIAAATAQALLSGQPLREEEEDEEATPLPDPRAIQKKPNYRDLPKLKPSIPALSLTYNYQRQILPPNISRKQYQPGNRHLPQAVMREDYDRHLFGAVAANDVNGTRAFLDMGKSVNLLNAKGETLLVTAARYGALDTARLLLARGASPSMAGTNGVTPLSIAQASGQRDMALALEARASYASYQPAK